MLGRKNKLRRSPSLISRKSIRREEGSRKYDPGGINQLPTVHNVERNNTMFGDGNGPPPRKTPWELYNDKASLYDREMLKEWDDNLSILLVFVSLFHGFLPVWQYSDLLVGVYLSLGWRLTAPRTETLRPWSIPSPIASDIPYLDTDHTTGRTLLWCPHHVHYRKYDLLNTR